MDIVVKKINTGRNRGGEDIFPIPKNKATKKKKRETTRKEQTEDNNGITIQF